MKAMWNGTVLADSEDTVLVEGNHYFPPDSLRMEYFTPTATQSTCGWKGTCNYYTVTAGGKANPDCAWVYPTPKPDAAHITGRVAFWKGVQVGA